MQPDFSKFSKHLFWDIDINKPDSGNWKSFFVKRVLEYGLYNDWLCLNEVLELKEIGEIAAQLRELDPKAHSFISIKSGIPEEQFRCYHTRLLTPQHWNF